MRGFMLIRALGIPLYCAASATLAFPVCAADWSTTELQFQYGRLDVPEFAGDGEDDTAIVTLQHASGYGWGDVFFFVDFLHGENGDVTHFNDNDAYGELYVNFSSKKLLKIDYGNGLLTDIGFIQGFNFDADANVYKILPGLRFSWRVPGFAFMNTDFMAYLDASSGVKEGTYNAPAETDSAMLDVNFAAPFQLYGQYFSFEGHVEFVLGRENEFGEDVAGHIFGQPQFRWDAGYALTGHKDKFFVGTEYQIWMHKLGEKNTNESAFQALAVWRF